MPQLERFKKTIFRLRSDLIFCLSLAIVTFAVYLQVKNYSFVNYDDVLYITQNPHIQKGLNLESLIWSFTTNHSANWHPLTWVSYLIDIQFFGFSPGVFHLTNVFFHIANTVILYIVLRIITTQLGQSAVVAFLFALHPLHVESVAWISERKDVLSTFFWLLTMLSYAWYAKRPYYQENAGILRYFSVIVSFLLGLMAKPMLVTLPFVLLLLDYWPLKRFRIVPSKGIGKNQDRSIILALIWEKVPFFILAVTISLVCYMAQKEWNTIATINDLPISVRFSNAMIAYVTYLIKMIWPFDLAVFYPHPGQVIAWKLLGTLLVLSCISVVAIKTAKHAPFMIVGWLWYLGTLVPVIGIVQVGEQALADRYTYVPLIGMFIMIAWGIPVLLPNRSFRRLAFGIVASAVITFFASITWFHLPIWKNSISLWENAVNVNSESAAAHNNLGNAFEENGNLTHAVEHYAEALRLKPGAVLFHRNMARALAAQGEIEQAVKHFSQALQMDPDSALSHYGLALILDKQGRLTEAICHLKEVIRINPEMAKANTHLNRVLNQAATLD